MNKKKILLIIVIVLNALSIIALRKYNLNYISVLLLISIPINCCLLGEMLSNDKLYYFGGVVFILGLNYSAISARRYMLLIPFAGFPIIWFGLVYYYLKIKKKKQ